MLPRPQPTQDRPAGAAPRPLLAALAALLAGSLPPLDRTLPVDDGGAGHAEKIIGWEGWVNPKTENALPSCATQTCPIGCDDKLRRCYRLKPAHVDPTSFFDAATGPLVVTGVGTIDTATGEIKDGSTIVRAGGPPGGATGGIYFGVIPQTGGPSLAVLAAATLEIKVGARVTVLGPNALVLYATTSGTVAGELLALGSGRAGGPGGFAGGLSNTASGDPCEGGEGKGGGTTGSSNNGDGGGGGGGFGSAGAAGAASDYGGSPPAGGAGGGVGGDPSLPLLRGGCGGGAGGGPEHGAVGGPGDGGYGGGGGGAIQISVNGPLTVSSSINVGGAGGEGGHYGAAGGGGGGGGAILLEALQLQLTGTLAANGGGGGAGSPIYTDPASNNGADGLAATTAAKGGDDKGSYSGAGGAGAALASAAVTPASDANSGGGGGGLGRIRLRASQAIGLGAATISPAPSTDLTLEKW